VGFAETKKNGTYNARHPCDFTIHVVFGTFCVVGNSLRIVIQVVSTATFVWKVTPWICLSILLDRECKIWILDLEFRIRKSKLVPSGCQYTIHNVPVLNRIYPGIVSGSSIHIKSM
jgi:hypothetical protein